MSKLLDKIQSRGHWKVVIRPGRFDPVRVADIGRLYPILERSAVLLRGWDFPHLSARESHEIGQDWTAQESQDEELLEVWRFFQSGQFLDFSGMRLDWMDQCELRAPTDPAPGVRLGVGDTLFRFTEIFEFATRLALTEAGDEEMKIEVTLSGLRGRILWVDDRRRAPFAATYKASIPEFTLRCSQPRAALVDRSWDLALEGAKSVFQRFGWNADLNALASHQAELKDRRRPTTVEHVPAETRGQPSLTPAQRALLKELVDRSRTPSGNFSEFFVVSTFGGTEVVFETEGPGISNVSLPSFLELVERGLVRMTTARSGAKRASVTNAGLAYLSQG